MAKKSGNRWTHKATNLKSNTRIAEYSAGVFSILGSKSAAKKALSSGRLWLNGRQASYTDVVKKGDLLELRGSAIQKIKKYEIDLEIIYEDDFLVVVNKPGGIAVNGNRYKTVENALADINKNNRQADALARPVAAHRIDVPTNGLVLLAKTKTALIQLGKAFQDNKVQKEYVALAHGQTPEKGQIDEAIQGKRAVTQYETLQSVSSKVFKHLSLLKLKPITGRTHQLRIHLKDKGHLIVGDKLYAEGRKTILGKGLLLCARRLQFAHPIDGRLLDLQIDPPTKFFRIMEREKNRFEK